jgi:hypothetical protein
MVGVLASVEPAGSLVAGLLVGIWTPRGRSTFWLTTGAAGLFLALRLASFVGRSEHPFSPLLSVLFVGGFASALYNIFQTTIVIDAKPERLRSRMMGLVTVCIGTWPRGSVIAGALPRSLGPLGALGVIGECGPCVPRPDCRDSASPLDRLQTRRVLLHTLHLCRSPNCRAPTLHVGD